MTIDQPTSWTEVIRCSLCPALTLEYTFYPLFHSRSHFQGHNLKRAVISHASKVLLKILQARLQKYMNCEIPDVQAGFKKGRGTRDQIDNIYQIIEKAREFCFCFIDYARAFDCVDHKKLENSERDGNTRPLDLPLEKLVCRSGSNSQNWT